MTSHEELRHLQELLGMERAADLEQYRQKVLQTSIEKKRQEGICWYPVVMRRHYIGTGERLIVEMERTTHLGASHTFQSGKVVTLFSNTGQQSGTGRHVTGVVNYVRDNQMVITLNEDELPEWIDDGKLGIDVMFDEATYREMERALKEVMKADKGRVAELREILLGHRPARQRAVGEAPALPRLNPGQQEALRQVISAQDVAIIHGPPGTGKTTTLVQSILFTLKSEGQTLVCAPSNAAVDLLTEKLSEEGLEVLRLGHPARVTDQTLSKTLDARIASHPHFRDLRAVRKKAEALKDMAYKYKRHYGHAEREQRKLLTNEAKALKADADMLEFYITNDLFHKADVITCTLVGASHSLLRGRRWATVFIDEAAQALEPACWIPLLKADRVVFAGDHCQLPPTVKSVEAARAGLAQTLFEKCVERQPTTATMLMTQYRMHEDIMAFSSRQFYRGALEAAPGNRQHVLREDIPPLEWVDTAGCGFEEEQDPETLSRFNTEEGRLLLRRLEALVMELGVETWLAQGWTLGVITPYKAQTLMLRAAIEEFPALGELGSLLGIDTVDAFQGQERDVIAISLTRSNEKGEIGFLADTRRMNVALTRARKRLMVVGDSATLGGHGFYAALVDYMQEKGAYHSAWEYMG
jgi:ATP-dependent RNA/DNA helicase IGHMBP2